MPQRLRLGPLPTDFAATLRGLSEPARSGETEGERISVQAPFTGEEIGWVMAGTNEDVARAFERARSAQLQWREESWARRRAIVNNFHDRLLRHRDLLCDIVQLETGKNRASAFDEVMDVATNARYYARHAEKFLAPQRRRGAVPVLSRSMQYHHPHGVVGQISPWNYPLSLGIGDAIPALLAGNAVVLKPDSATPFTALLAYRLLFDAGLPRELVQIVTGSGTVVGAAVAEQCDYLMFTGSSATGALLGATAGRRLIGYSAELGGKNPMIVAADADCAAAARVAVDGCFSNSGQLCVSIERIYVDRRLFDQFREAFVQKVKEISLVNGFEWGAGMGSLASAQQLETVRSFVDDARAHGAQVLTGGRARPDLGPYFYEPTVLAGVPEQARLRREEVFGPVVYLEAVDTAQEAIERANDTRYGLNASVCAAPATAWALAPHVESGSVAINDGYTTAWAAIDTPMGGRKDSGLAHRHGREGIVKYTASQNVTEQRWMSIRGPQRLPRRGYAAIMAAALRVGKTLRFLP
ncbi:Putative succinate-semialdehyde dehydrogenase [NADP(+)] 2 [Corynebacterium ciconiae DSM 44920]|nr:succinic semialdehyde dehydrogenase [Corynebacterium ciconiae]WKD60290.1 Putative succinate-semialdehyde dehydrogenase [NADP(+)] 2 [Corynebacterium ciconiae DSM 44920]